MRGRTQDAHKLSCLHRYQGLPTYALLMEPGAALFKHAFEELHHWLTRDASTYKLARSRVLKEILMVYQIESQIEDLPQRLLMYVWPFPLG